MKVNTKTQLSSFIFQLPSNSFTQDPPWRTSLTYIYHSTICYVYLLRRGLEPPSLTAYEPQSYMYTIPSPELINYHLCFLFFIPPYGHPPRRTCIPFHFIRLFRRAPELVGPRIVILRP